MGGLNYFPVTLADMPVFSDEIVPGIDVETPVTIPALNLLRPDPLKEVLAPFVVPQVIGWYLVTFPKLVIPVLPTTR